MPRIVRALKNLCYPECRVRRIFSDGDMSAIEAAIAAAEGEQSCEIRFVVEGGLPLEFLGADGGARRRAIELFASLGVWNTEKNNGILFYLLVAERSFELVADRAVTRLLGESEWTAIGAPIRRELAAGRWKEGVIAGIQGLAASLRPHFPPEDKHGELPNEPVLL